MYDLQKEAEKKNSMLQIIDTKKYNKIDHKKNDVEI
jgi:hypothetical protein